MPTGSWVTGRTNGRCEDQPPARDEGLAILVLDPAAKGEAAVADHDRRPRGYQPLDVRPLFPTEAAGGGLVPRHKAQWCPGLLVRAPTVEAIGSLRAVLADVYARAGDQVSGVEAASTAEGADQRSPADSSP